MIKTINDCIEMIYSIDETVEELQDMAIKMSADESRKSEYDAINRAIGYVRNYGKMLLNTEVEVKA